MSEGLHEWKAPLQMKRMWSVLTLPYLVDTTEPSMMGSRSLWTPSELASAPVDEVLRKHRFRIEQFLLFFCSLSLHLKCKSQDVHVIAEMTI